MTPMTKNVKLCIIILEPFKVLSHVFIIVAQRAERHLYNLGEVVIGASVVGKYYTMTILFQTGILHVYFPPKTELQFLRSNGKNLLYRSCTAISSRIAMPHICRNSRIDRRVTRDARYRI
jgi:hypothetical protein